MNIKYNKLLWLVGLGVVGGVLFSIFSTVWVSKQSIPSIPTLCLYGPFKFEVDEKDCALLNFDGSSGLTFGYDLEGAKVIREELVEGNKIIIRMRAVSKPAARSSVAIQDFQPTELRAGRKIYVVRGEKIVVFVGGDGEPVYVDSGLTTYELDRMYKMKYEVLYQIDKKHEDFEGLDSRVMALLNKIIVQ